MEGMDTDIKNGCDFELVSIIMPNYNSEKFISSSIESVIAQTYVNWELIIIDDCSTDTSIEIAERFKDARIKIIKNKKNYGAAVSRNNGIKSANGRYIAFLDSDDVWDENKLLESITFMREKGFSFICTDYRTVAESGEHISNYSPQKSSYNYFDILKHNVIGCSTVVYDKNILGEVLMPIEATMREDFACWLAILKKGYVVNYLHKILTEYKVRSNSVSSKKTKMIKYQWKVYRRIEKLPFFKSLYYLAHWAIKGLFKYKS